MTINDNGLFALTEKEFKDGSIEKNLYNNLIETYEKTLSREMNILKEKYALLEVDITNLKAVIKHVLDLFEERIRKLEEVNGR